MKLKNSLTTNLIVVIAGFFIVAKYAPTVTWGSLGLQDHLLLINKAIFNDGQVHGVFAGEWWRVLTVVLTHSSWLHLASNMLVLFQLGNIVENFYGKTRFSIILLVAALSASAASLWLDPVNQPSVGASGMIFGLFATMLVSGRRLGVDPRQVMGLLVLNIAFSFVPGVDWHAHAGGFIGGLIASLILQALPPRRRRATSVWE
jgi:membrane associated rhomboid family serine protease